MTTIDWAGCPLRVPLVDGVLDPLVDVLVEDAIVEVVTADNLWNWWKYQLLLLPKGQAENASR